MFNEANMDATQGPICSGAEALPKVFCWTKMGTEAGQGLESILRRKEFERLSGGGMFVWGIGNSVGPAVQHARELGYDCLDVLFTRIKSAPKSIDVSPSTLVLWTAYEGENGEEIPLPEHTLVTSRGNSAEGASLKRSHYALLCRSSRSLLNSVDNQTVDSAAVCNLVSRSSTGASQVTAVVRTRPSSSPGKPYPVQFRAKLTGKGFVRLVQPVTLTAELLSLYRDAAASICAQQWRDRVAALRSAVEFRNVHSAGQRTLFS